MSTFLKLHASDNVRVALKPVNRGDQFQTEQGPVTVECEVGMAHKIADRLIKSGELVIKYGLPIGEATADIQPGEHVHVHNVVSRYTPTYHHESEPETADG